MGSKPSGFTPRRFLLYMQRNRRQVFSFLICLALSALLWFTIKLNRQYVHAVSYQVSFNSLWSEQELTPLQPSVINLEIRTHGYQILFHQFARAGELTLDLDRAFLREARQPGIFFITAQSLIARISSQLPLSSTVLTVKPDTLFFSLAQTTSRKVAIRPDLSAEFRHGFDLHDTVQIKPDSVVISGNQKLVDQIQFIRTSSLSLPLSEGSFRYRASLVNPYPDKLSLETDGVEISGTISRFVEKSFFTQVITSDTVLSAGVLKHPTVEVKCQIPAEEAASFNPLTVEVIAAKLIKEGGILFAILDTRYPAFVKKVKLIPDRIPVEPVKD